MSTDSISAEFGSAESVTEDHIELCAADDLWIGEMECFDAGAQEVLVVNIDGELHAYDALCPHQSIPLIEGRLDGKVLTCRAHEWSFDACTGHGINPKGECLRRFPLRIVDGKVFVAIEPVDD
jgi:toluene monooxygenase system ferredoxin subunit